jgi:hypothetical protein
MAYRSFDKKKLAKVKKLKGKTSYEVAPIIGLSQAQTWRYQQAAGTITNPKRRHIDFDWIN